MHIPPRPYLTVIIVKIRKWEDEIGRRRSHYRVVRGQNGVQLLAFAFTLFLFFHTPKPLSYHFIN